MPRQARLRIAGLPLHLVHRGNDKRPCFGGERDYRVYLSLLDDLSERHECAIHAYVLMTNHVHLLLTPEKPDAPSALMKHLGQRYAQYINRKYDRTGTLFEGRFKSCVIDSEAYLLRCHRYIEMNPVRAGMVAHPAQYPWSSYTTNANGEPSPFLQSHPEYSGLGRTREQRCERYRELFTDAAPTAELERIRETLNGGLVLGREQFIEALPDAFAKRAVKGRPGRPRRSPPTLADRSA